ncbi:MAG: hypothetical protein Q8888_02485 [Vigna little leaf phytoplasma]|nr:hypothetical protein [Vigna little leaf phytoplasma]
MGFVAHILTQIGAFLRQGWFYIIKIWFYMVKNFLWLKTNISTCFFFFKDNLYQKYHSFLTTFTATKQKYWPYLLDIKTFGENCFSYRNMADSFNLPNWLKYLLTPLFFIISSLKTLLFSIIGVMVYLVLFVLGIIFFIALIILIFPLFGFALIIFGIIALHPKSITIK